MGLYDVRARRAIGLVSGDRRASLTMKGQNPAFGPEINFLEFDAAPLMIMKQGNLSEMSLSLDSEAQPTLRLERKEGKGGVVCSADSIGSFIELKDSKSRMRAGMALWRGERAEFNFLDEHLAPRLSIEIDVAGRLHFPQFGE
jgi:hypothetical protein